MYWTRSVPSRSTSEVRNVWSTSPLGVFRAIEQERYGDLVRKQNDQAVAKLGRGDLQQLVTGEETWTVV